MNTKRCIARLVLSVLLVLLVLLVTLVNENVVAKEGPIGPAKDIKISFDGYDDIHGNAQLRIQNQLGEEGIQFSIFNYTREISKQVLVNPAGTYDLVLDGYEKAIFHVDNYSIDIDFVLPSGIVEVQNGFFYDRTLENNWVSKVEIGVGPPPYTVTTTVTNTGGLPMYGVRSYILGFNNTPDMESQSPPELLATAVFSKQLIAAAISIGPQDSLVSQMGGLRHFEVVCALVDPQERQLESDELDNLSCDKPYSSIYLPLVFKN